MTSAPRTFERTTARAAEQALQDVVRWLSANGYQVATRSAAEMHLVHPARRERLAVRVTAAGLRFEFSPSVPGAALSADDVLERVVDEAVRGGGGGRATGASRRCTVCATQATGDDAFCAVCGGTLA